MTLSIDSNDAPRSPEISSTTSKRLFQQDRSCATDPFEESLAKTTVVHLLTVSLCKSPSGAYQRMLTTSALELGFGCLVSPSSPPEEEPQANNDGADCRQSYGQHCDGNHLVVDVVVATVHVGASSRSSGRLGEARLPRAGSGEGWSYLMAVHLVK